MMVTPLCQQFVYTAPAVGAGVRCAEGDSPAWRQTGWRIPAEQLHLY